MIEMSIKEHHFVFRNRAQSIYIYIILLFYGTFGLSNQPIDFAWLSPLFYPREIHKKGIFALSLARHRLPCSFDR